MEALLERLSSNSPVLVPLGICAGVFIATTHYKKEMSLHRDTDTYILATSGVVSVSGE